MSRSLGPGRYDPLYEEEGQDYPAEYVRWTLNRNMGAFLGLLASGRVDVEALVASEFPLEKAPDAYESLGAAGGVALVLTYGKAEGQPKPVVLSRPRKSAEGRLNVGLVGPGGFAKETLIPLLRSSQDYALRWVVSSSPTNAVKVQKRYGFEKSTTDLGEALKDEDLNAVIICSPNNLHYPMLAESMRAGKAALVEKPLCLDRTEFEEIKKMQRELSLPIVVGFNRRYAPLILKVKERMKKTDGPFMITYRVNAGFTPASRWYLDPLIGGGRIIHECCHFFDLFNFLLGRSDAEVVARTTGINGSTSVARDNISATLTYGDGSVANLVYASLGDKSLERERMEVFGQGRSMVLNDFRELMIYGMKLRAIRPERG